MHYLTGFGLLIFGIFLIYVSQSKGNKKRSKSDDKIFENLESRIELHNRVNNFELLLLGIVSSLIGIIFLLVELGLVDIPISE